MRAMEMVSPNSIWTAVDVTGARSKGQSSRSKGRWMVRSHTSDSRDPGTQVTHTNFAPLACSLPPLRRPLPPPELVPKGASLANQGGKSWKENRAGCLAKQKWQKIAGRDKFGGGRGFRKGKSPGSPLLLQSAPQAGFEGCCRQPFLSSCTKLSACRP